MANKKDNSILATKYLMAILKENQAVMDILGTETNKIFPLQQPENLSFPFIVIQRNSIMPTYTKDYMGWSNLVTFEIACVSNDYIQSLELANAVRNAIEWYRWQDSNINITRINIDMINEFVIDNDNAPAYVQSISISSNIDPI